MTSGSTIGGGGRYRDIPLACRRNRERYRGKLLTDIAAFTAVLYRLPNQAPVLTRGPRSWPRGAD